MPSAEWRKANPERARAQARRQRERDPEKARAARRASYAKNPAKELAANRAREKATDPEIKRARQRAYIESRPGWWRETQKANLHKRNARLRDGHSPGVTPEQWQEILEYFNHCCAYCLKPSARLEREHVRAVATGGLDEPDNVVPACRSCNAKKHAKLLILWIAA